MNWEYLITGVIGILTGGGITWLFRIREEKAGSKADVVDSSTEAMNKMMVLIDTQQDRFNKIIADKDVSIGERDLLINEYRKTLEDLNSQIRELNLKVAENDRKIAGLQKAINNEIKERKKAEHNICFVDDCKLREPKLGTYKKEA